MLSLDQSNRKLTWRNLALSLSSHTYLTVFRSTSLKDVEISFGFKPLTNHVHVLNFKSICYAHLNIDTYVYDAYLYLIYKDLRFHHVYSRHLIQP